MKLFLCCSLIFIASCAVPQKAASSRRLPETVLKIGIVQSAKSFNLSCQGTYNLFEYRTGKKANIKPLNDYLVRVAGRDGIRFDGMRFSSPLRIVSMDQKNRIQINGRRYRDNVIVYASTGALTVVNEVGLESYICGILPREIDPGWTMEALKTQAIISRTYALRNLRRHEGAFFDLCADQHCQVYGGSDSEEKESTKAVALTRGEVVVYKGILAQTFFHASCAGHTEDPSYIWSIPPSQLPYLRGVTCKFCKSSPYHRWQTQLTGGAIREKLNAAGFKIGPIAMIGRSGTTSSGRVRNIRIKQTNGISIDVPAAKFRTYISPWQIKSTFINGIVKKDDSYQFTGKGWGHGVGLCQWGAKVMADRKYTYRQILKYYYPGTIVERWED